MFRQPSGSDEEADAIKLRCGPTGQGRIDPTPAALLWVATQGGAPLAGRLEHTGFGYYKGEEGGDGDDARETVERCGKLMLQAYCDGSTEAGVALIFAGYLGSVDTWLAFSNEWDELLKLGPGAFKMSDIGASQMERAMFHYRLIEKAPIYGIGCAIPIGSLRKVVDELQVNPAYSNPYLLAWRAILTLVLEGAKILGLIDPIEFIFDKQSDQVHIIRSWEAFYDTVPMITRGKIRGRPSFRNDKEIVPLQAADMLAWWARKQYLSNKSNMKALFPDQWTRGKEPHLLFAEMSEESIRLQFLKDIETAKNQPPRLRACLSYFKWSSDELASD